MVRNDKHGMRGDALQIFGKIWPRREGEVPRNSSCVGPSARAMVEVVTVAQLHFVALSHLPYYR
jgi:hypothetical protein